MSYHLRGRMPEARGRHRTRQPHDGARHYGTEVLAYVAIAATVASAAVATYGAYQQGENAEKAAKYNAEVAEQQAQDERDAAAIKAEQIRRRNRLVQGAVRANAYGSGLDMAPGSSALEVLADNAYQGELDAIYAEHTGDVMARGHRSRATMSRFEGRTAKQVAGMQMASSALGGISSASQQYGRLNTRPAGGWS